MKRTYFAPYSLKLISTGSALPANKVNNDQLLNALRMHTNANIARKAERIIKKIGVKERYLSRSLQESIESANPSAPELCKLVIEDAYKNISNEIEFDYLIGHTASPHTLIPPNIAWVAEKLQYHGPYMELRQACTGFVNALQIASPMLNASPNLSNIMIVGSETGSVYFDCARSPDEISQLVNYVQMGDGAAGVLVAKDDNSNENIISDIFIGHIGLDKKSGFYLEGGSNKPYCTNGSYIHHFHHKTKYVVKFGRQLFALGLNAIMQRGYQLDDFKFIIPHQVNGYLADIFSQSLNISSKKIIVDANRVGNMGSAAIWYSFDQLIKSNQLSKGDKVLILGAEATKYLYGGFVYQH